METYGAIVRELDAIFGLIFKDAEMDRRAVLTNRLRNLLFGKWNLAQKEALNDTLRYLGAGKGKISKKEVEGLLNRLENVLGAPVSEGVRNELRGVVSDAYGEGVESVLGTVPGFDVVDDKALKWLEDDAIYWVGSYYNRKLRGELRSEAQKVIEQGLDRDEAAESFQAKFGSVFGGGKAYWDLVSHNIVHRSREFGSVSGYEKGGIKKLKVVAFLDDRTTEICRDMNGRIIQVKKAVELRDKLMGAKRPTDVKKIAPWHSGAPFKKVKSEKLPVGMSLPPYHAYCRTTTIAVPGDYKEAEPDITGVREAGLSAGMNDYQQADRVLASNWEENLEGRAVVREVLARTFDGYLAKLPSNFYNLYDTPRTISGFCKPKRYSGSMVGDLLPGDYIGSGRGKPYLAGAEYVALSSNNFSRVDSIRLPAMDKQISGSVFSGGETPTVSIAISRALVKKDMPNIAGTAIHETGHVIRFMEHEKVAPILEKYYYRREKGKPKPVSMYANIPEYAVRGYPAGEEYFAETFAAYIVANKHLRESDPVGAEMIDEVLEKVGLKDSIRIWGEGNMSDVSKGDFEMKESGKILYEGRITGKKLTSKGWVDAYMALVKKYFKTEDSGFWDSAPKREIVKFLEDDFFEDWPFDFPPYGDVVSPGWDKFIAEAPEDQSFKEFLGN